MRLTRPIIPMLTLLALSLLPSCEREPLLHLVDPETELEFETNKIILDLQVLWEYDITYDWESQWWYNWDERDDSLFGTWELQEPTTFNIRRYYTEEIPDAPHNEVLRDVVTGHRYQARYKYGYYDVLVWNDVNTIDGVQSLHYDEESTLEYVTAYTNQSNAHTSTPHHAPTYRPGYAFYQPEFLFSGEYDDLHVTDNPADYDSLIINPDGSTTWYKFVPLLLTPVTYIYLTQVIIHHNGNKIAGVDGSGNLTGLARSVNLNSHVTSEQDISVNYPMRMKKHMTYIAPQAEEAEDVDIIGGRVLTFGLTGVDPFRITRASTSYQQVVESPIRNYLELDMLFHNGYDSTFVFDVTDQVKERYKGGVITVHIDADEIELPSNKGGSLFDAEIKDYEEETHEFDM